MDKQMTLVDLVGEAVIRKNENNKGIDDDGTGSDAIVYADFDGTVKTISYEQMWLKAEKVAQVLTTIRSDSGDSEKDTNCVVGICIDTSQLIPSLMIGVMIAKCAFTFIPIKYQQPD